MRRLPTEKTSRTLEYGPTAGTFEGAFRGLRARYLPQGIHMVDGEVVRLRRLRSTALCVRALARAFGAANSAADAALFSRAGCACWRVARTVSGRLKAHPHLSYQKGASSIGAVWDNAVARSLAHILSDKAHILNSFTTNLRLMSRELDDARALTWSIDLSDAFARSRAEIKTLIGAFRGATLRESASTIARDPELAAMVGAAEAYSTSIVADWPYLAR